MEDTVLIAGAGLSKVADVPTTEELPRKFLSLPQTRATTIELQNEISRHLTRFWRDVFGYEAGSTHCKEPSFEDHFTVLDLAANTGQQLGPWYSPKRLRAIRRLSIHRVFDVLDSSRKHEPVLAKFLAALAEGSRNAIVTTNWDIVIEKHLGENPFHYGVPAQIVGAGRPWPTVGLPLLKLHGSSNWAYCDCCGKLFGFHLTEGKGTLLRQLLVEREDFRILDRRLPRILELPGVGEECQSCRVRLTSRVATFSYVKVLDFVHFMSIWEGALRALAEAKHWIFVGYSLPQSDFHLRHLLKRAQMARLAGAPLRITVVSRDTDTPARYRSFFGEAITEVSSEGFLAWAASQAN